MPATIHGADTGTTQVTLCGRGSANLAAATAVVANRHEKNRFNVRSSRGCAAVQRERAERSTDALHWSHRRQAHGGRDDTANNRARQSSICLQSPHQRSIYLLWIRVSDCGKNLLVRLVYRRLSW